MITDDPKASDVIIEKGIATSMFFSFIDQVTREINEFAAASGLITVEDEGTPLTTALEKMNFIGAGVTVTEPAANELDITILAGGDMVSTNDLSDVDDPAQARVNLGVDPAGTDNSTDVTLVGAGTYLSLAGQEITQRALTDDDITMIQLAKIVDEVSNTYYVCEALPGTASSAASWRAKRIVYTGDDSVTTWADGNSDYDNIADNRLSLSYS